MQLRALMLATALVWMSVLPGSAQELADFDYENLAFRGFGLEFGYLWSDKVEPMPEEQRALMVVIEATYRSAAKGREITL